MIDFSILPLFFISVFFLVISPGPDLLLISTYASIRGFHAGIAIALGILIAGLVQTTLVAFGLGQLMQAVPVVALGVKIIGALYLAWLGLRMLKSWFQRDTVVKNDAQIRSLSMTQLMYQGLWNNLMNPKALLFFSMFLPQFTNSQFELTSQILVLGLLLSVTAFVMNILFALIFSKLSAYFEGKLTLGRHVDGLLGVIFLGLATRLVTSK
ncbi:LysE family translocator [Vibrio sp. MEBiC08052]|uniref:LysE family translocator n=1 Tax=Vibrio sp. MEBiC08052 TaxID=1761910 RepID=UPI00074075B6|nr:LysE family translocator [Vibrio sp. MEBiC08052]KUI97764.1 putative threonine efflux protein [Vibrio sp. MEBiC08052]